MTLEITQAAREAALPTEDGVIRAILSEMNTHGISQRALARELGVSEANISKALRTGSNMTLQKVERIATAIRALGDRPV